MKLNVSTICTGLPLQKNGNKSWTLRISNLVWLSNEPVRVFKKFWNARHAIEEFWQVLGSFVDDVCPQYLHCTDEDQQSETARLSTVVFWSAEARTCNAVSSFHESHQKVFVCVLFERIIVVSWKVEVGLVKRCFVGKKKRLCKSLVSEVLVYFFHQSLNSCMCFLILFLFLPSCSIFSWIGFEVGTVRQTFNGKVEPFLYTVKTIRKSQAFENFAFTSWERQWCGQLTCSVLFADFWAVCEIAGSFSFYGALWLFSFSFLFQYCKYLEALSNTCSPPRPSSSFPFHSLLLPSFSFSSSFRSIPFLPPSHVPLPAADGHPRRWVRTHVGRWTTSSRRPPRSFRAARRVHRTKRSKQRQSRLTHRLGKCARTGNWRCAGQRWRWWEKPCLVVTVLEIGLCVLMRGRSTTDTHEKKKLKSATKSYCLTLCSRVSLLLCAPFSSLLQQDSLFEQVGRRRKLLDLNGDNQLQTSLWHVLVCFQIDHLHNYCLG